MTNNQQLKAHCEDVIANPQDHSEMALAMATALLPCLNAKPSAWGHRLVNKRNGVEHPWVYGSAETAASEGDIFRVEILKLYTAPPVPDHNPASITKDVRKLAEDIVENLVDCSGADESAVEQYTAWVIQRLNGVTS